MRRFIGLVAAALFLTACNQPAQQAPADSTAADAAVPVDSPTVQAAAPAAYNPDFPTGFVPAFKYSIRSRSVEDAAGGKQRRLVIEYKDGDAPAIDKQIEELLAAKGYKRYKTFERGDDLVGDYGKSGKRITVTTTPANDNLKMKLAADSLGTVYFVWQE
ncbi:hypothetical protein ACFOLC_10705 [Lysobacter cavernae]|uniref:Lipoprotein n=1 Tax=Lysobacter cavernae TaxID=1685901 RepID=A0ABV7RQS5_9GAMM